MTESIYRVVAIENEDCIPVSIDFKELPQAKNQLDYMLPVTQKGIKLMVSEYTTDKYGYSIWVRDI